MRPAIALFFLSPLIAEFLLGNVAIDGIIAIIFLAPMYGGGALLIRELARRSGGGWPTIFVLGLAYSTWEEALVTQLLFNPTYHGLSLAGAIITGLGVSATQIINIVTLHTVWSVAVSICLVELFVPKRRTEPWLGPVGLVFTFLLFLLGSGYICYSEYLESGFFANGLQLIGGVAAVTFVSALAFMLPRGAKRESGKTAPKPWLVLFVSLISTSLFMVLLFEYLPGWPGVVAWAALVTSSGFLLSNWSRRSGWCDWHQLGLVAGALLTYAWSAFPQQPVIGTPGAVDFAGNIIFACTAIILWLAAAYRIRSSQVSNLDGVSTATE